MAPLNAHTVGIEFMAHGLQSLQGILKKAAAHPDAATFASARLIDDMKPLSFQVQLVAKTAEGTVAHLTAQEPGEAPADETTLEQLQARVDSALALLQGVQANALAGAEERAVTVKYPGVEFQFDGAGYLLGFGLPNFAFHLMTAYNILRMKGLDIGKTDYLGSFLQPNIVKQA